VEPAEIDAKFPTLHPLAVLKIRDDCPEEEEEMIYLVEWCSTRWRLASTGEYPMYRLWEADQAFKQPSEHQELQIVGNAERLKLEEYSRRRRLLPSGTWIEAPRVTGNFLSQQKRRASCKESPTVTSPAKQVLSILDNLPCSPVKLDMAVKKATPKKLFVASSSPHKYTNSKGGYGSDRSITTEHKVCQVPTANLPSFVRDRGAAVSAPSPKARAKRNLSLWSWLGKEPIKPSSIHADSGSPCAGPSFIDKENVTKKKSIGGRGIKRKRQEK